jgi:hypothetical protein
MQGQTEATEAFHDLADAQARAIEGLKDARVQIEDYARANPKTAIAIAAGVGFLLGGGLTPRLLVGLGALAARGFAKDYVRGQIASFANDLVGEPEDARASAS